MHIMPAFGEGRFRNPAEARGRDQNRNKDAHSHEPGGFETRDTRRR